MEARVSPKAARKFSTRSSTTQGGRRLWILILKPTELLIVQNELITTYLAEVHAVSLSLHKTEYYSP